MPSLWSSWHLRTSACSTASPPPTACPHGACAPEQVQATSNRKKFLGSAVFMWSTGLYSTQSYVSQIRHDVKQLLGLQLVIWISNFHGAALIYNTDLEISPYWNQLIFIYKWADTGFDIVVMDARVSSPTKVTWETHTHITWTHTSIYFLSMTHPRTHARTHIAHISLTCSITHWWMHAYSHTPAAYFLRT